MIDDPKTSGSDPAPTASEPSTSPPKAMSATSPEGARDERSGPTVAGAAPSLRSRDAAAVPGGGHSVEQRAPRRSLTTAEAQKHVVLFLAANPSETDRLALDREARAIRLELKRSGHRDRFEFVTRWAAEPLDLLRELRELRPTVVHFSGHSRSGRRRGAGSERDRDIVDEPTSKGELQGLVFQDAAGNSQVVSAEALAQTLDAAGTSVMLVVLNACYTAPIAVTLLAHVDCVVGISGSIHDDAARSFAIGFYGGIGEHETIMAAYKQGCAAIALEGLPESQKPVLQVRDGIDPDQLILNNLRIANVAPARTSRATLGTEDCSRYAPEDMAGGAITATDGVLQFAAVSIAAQDKHWSAKEQPVAF